MVQATVLRSGDLPGDGEADILKVGAAASFRTLGTNNLCKNEGFQSSGIHATALAHGGDLFVAHRVKDSVGTKNLRGKRKK